MLFALAENIFMAGGVVIDVVCILCFLALSNVSIYLLIFTILSTHIIHEIIHMNYSMFYLYFSRILKSVINARNLGVTVVHAMAI